MITEFPYAVIVIGAVLVGLWVSNTLYDLKVPHYISRKIGHSAGGLGFLTMILAFSFGLILWLAHVWRPKTFRGVGGNGRDLKVMSEVWFAWIAVPIFAV